MSVFRPDIEGLRAISVLLVVAYHFAGPWVPGGFVGVDVFFVISGYLITRSLLEQHAAGESLRSNLLHFWARRARRLLPNALLVLVAVSLTAVWCLDDVALSRLGSDVAWSAGYAVNWLYVLRAVDYLRWGETDASVLLNYWSLAVEEQFYLLWPLILLVAWRHMGCGTRARHAALLIAALLALLSFGHMLSRDGLALSFFATPARAWELLVGAVLALQMRDGRAWSGRWGVAAAWVGLVGVLAAAATMSSTSRHSGWVTLMPVLGTALLIGGLTGRPAELLVRGLGCVPLQALGARSYSIYLWHWPVLTLGTYLWPQRSGWATLSWLVLALVLAEAAYRGIESPARWRWGPSALAVRVLLLALGASLLLAVAGIGLHWSAEAGQRRNWLPPAPHGAAGLPTLQQVKNDLPEVYRNRCHLGVAPTEPADGCRFFARLATLRPSLVVVSNLVDDETAVVDRTDGRLLQGGEAAAAFDAGLMRTLQRLRAAGVPTVLLRDTPRPRRDALACLYAVADPSQCERPRSEAMSADPRDVRVAHAAGIPVWDLNSVICGQESCPVFVRSGEPPRPQVVYRDDNHLTASYAASLGPHLERAWAEAPPWRGR